MLTSLTTYLPTYMKMQGASLIISGGALSILELAGVVGALTGGTLSDRLGRKLTLLAATVLSVILMFVFLNVQGLVLVPVLLGLGLTALSTAPVLMAMVQDHMPNNRAIGNGLLMFTSFLVRPVAMIAIGLMGDYPAECVVELLINFDLRLKEARKGLIRHEPAPLLQLTMIEEKLNPLSIVDDI